MIYVISIYYGTTFIHTSFKGLHNLMVTALGHSGKVALQRYEIEKNIDEK